MKPQIKPKKDISYGSGFPHVRLRRLRKNQAIRDLFQETRIFPSDFIYPIFVEDQIREPKKIGTMEEIKRLPLSRIINEIESLLQTGLKSIILFGVSSQKDEYASSAYSQKGIVQKAIKEIRSNFGEKIVIITDVCMCQYTTHGHCGIVKNKIIDNDLSNHVLSKIAESHALAGADIVAPSAMMDGQISFIRDWLDIKGYSDTLILSYSAKFASPLYNPFRDFADSTPKFGDRKTYQMPFTNINEAIREIDSDISEGADMIMIKPAIPYLDLINQVRDFIRLPICAYSVSGEYALIKAASEQGWINETEVMVEFLTSIKRAGADMIITYYAKKIASLLKNELFYKEN
ncbi:MAG: porphobilinogen synthase [Nitrososphaeraceae archaeon]|nr:porphobilinogen synthase [Nitrososphaeraceae archaeon]